MSSEKNLNLKKTSFLSKINSSFIEQMYLRYINKDPLTLFKQLKRISTSGFSYKVYEINKNINISKIK